MDSIPWYKSQVFVSALVSIITQAGVILGLGDVVSEGQVAHYVDAGLQLVALAAAGWAALKRYRSKDQPLAATQSSADAKTAAKSHPLIGLLLLLTTFAMLTGCPATLAVKEAQTVEQRAAALIGDFTIFQRAAIEIGNDETIPAEVRQRVVEAPIALKPGVDRLFELLATYRMVNDQLAAGATTDEKVQIAAANLGSWVLDLSPKIAALRQTVKEARK